MDQNQKQMIADLWFSLPRVERQAFKDNRKSVKGYAPPAPVKKVANPYADMTVRAAIRAYFTRNSNKPATYHEISEVIGRNKGTVGAMLSLYPEFILINGQGVRGCAGQWQAHPTWISNGWVTVGR